MVCTVVFTISAFVFTTSSSVCPVLLIDVNKCVPGYVLNKKVNMNTIIGEILKNFTHFTRSYIPVVK